MRTPAATLSLEMTTRLPRVCLAALSHDVQCSTLFDSELLQRSRIFLGKVLVLFSSLSDPYCSVHLDLLFRGRRSLQGTSCCALPIFQDLPEQICLRDRNLSITFSLEHLREAFQRTKPHLNVGTIGHVDHGKVRFCKLNVSG